MYQCIIYISEKWWWNNENCNKIRKQLNFDIQSERNSVLLWHNVLDHCNTSKNFSSSKDRYFHKHSTSLFRKMSVEMNGKPQYTKDDVMKGKIRINYQLCWAVFGKCYSMKPIYENLQNDYRKTFGIVFK